MLLTQISLTLSLSSFVSIIHLTDFPDYILCLYTDVVDKFLLVVQHLHVHVNGSIGKCRLWVCLYTSSSVCSTCLVHLTWKVLERGGGWPYSCCWVECCFQDLFNIACCILVHFPSSFFSIHLVSIHVVHPYSNIDTTAAWKKLRYI